MRNYCIIISVLILSICFGSCSQEEQSKTQNPTALRPSVPVQVGEVRIGNQIWMTKNLNVSRYRNGDVIPEVNNPSQWYNLRTGAWCYYAYVDANGLSYGKLYNWYAVNDPRGLAPVGYHIPSDAEWTALIEYLGGENNAGAVLKATTGWEEYPTFVSNSSGFTALPGGFTVDAQNFGFVGRNGLWWSSTNDFEDIWMRVMFFNDMRVERNTLPKNSGLSVRCLKN